MELGSAESAASIHILSFSVKKLLIPEEKSKQNITRDIEVKNNLTIARGEWGGDSGERGLQEQL